MTERRITDANWNVIGKYYIDDDAEREMYRTDGFKVDYMNNKVNDLLDSFEDGDCNEIEDGYEVMRWGKYVIKRKIAKIVMFEEA